MTLDSQLCSELWLSVKYNINQITVRSKKNFLESAATTSKASHPVIIHRNRFQLSFIHLIGDNMTIIHWGSRFHRKHGVGNEGGAKAMDDTARRDCPCIFFFVVRTLIIAPTFHPPCHRWLPWLGLFFENWKYFELQLMWENNMPFYTSS